MVPLESRKVVTRLEGKVLKKMRKSMGGKMKIEILIGKGKPA